MKKQILFAVSLLLILGACSWQIINKSLAQSQMNTQTPDFRQQIQTGEIPENVAYAQFFRVINSFEKEAQKQENRGLVSRAEALRRTFQELLQLDDHQFEKLKETSNNFSGKLSRLKLKAKRLGKSKISKAEKNGGMKKIEKQADQLPLFYRDILRKTLGDESFERFAESFQKKVAVKIIYRFDSKSQSLFVGYSTISYNQSSGEVIGYSSTPAGGGLSALVACDIEESACVGTSVTATLSSDAEGVIDGDQSEVCDGDAEVFLYASASLPGVNYCVNGDHIYDSSSFCSFQGGGIYSTSEDCLITPPAPNVTSVTFQTIAANSPAIDANPNIGGGRRIFPDDNEPLENVNRQTIQVTAVISEAVAGRMVYFRNFDVDDPSTDTTIDPNGNTENDNNGRVN